MSRSSATSDKKSQEDGSLRSLISQDRIQVVKLYGVISDDGSGDSIFSMGKSTSSVKKKLKKAVKDDHVKGVLIRINSPGGTVGMSQEIYETIQELRSKGKPVVVSMGDIAASGGYYIASAADRIFANPGTLTGSIGVIMHLMNWQDTEKKIGIQSTVIKSGMYKDIGSPDRPMTPEEHALLQGIIMDTYDQFVSAVAHGRKMDKEVIKKLADGRIYSGRQAEKNKLVDQIGGYDDALVWLQKTCRDKNHLSKDLDVDDGNSSSEVLSSLFSSFGGPTSAEGQHGALLKQLLPASLDPNLNKVPLWIMQ